jgi:hypothetical protein
MRKTNPQFRWHLTAKEIKQIRKLTLQRVPQGTIASVMSVGRATVSKWQLRLGLPTRVPVPEAKIMELFEKGWGGYRISKHLHVPVNQVYGVAHRNNFHRKDGAGYPTPLENEMRFAAAVRKREDYIIRLARKYKIGICKAQRLAREILDTPRFRPGASKPVLSSDFPQRHFDVAFGGHQRDETLAYIVRNAVAAGFGGKVPENLAGLSRLVAACIGVCVAICHREKPEVYFSPTDQEKLTDFFMPRFLETIHTLRSAENGFVN